ncbi:MAG: deoxyribodipyrimidine photo-lyase [Saprospiraceae bacterium]
MKAINKRINIFWFRRDLRWHDNTALYHALNARLPVLPIFIFDKNILDKLEHPDDARVTFIFDTLMSLRTQACQFGSDIDIKYGFPIDILEAILMQHNVQGVYCNNDYESYAISRDTKIGEMCGSNGIEFHSFKDHVIFEKSEIAKDDGKPYTVFTPYKKKWYEKLNSQIYLDGKYDTFKGYPSELLLDSLVKEMEFSPMPSLEEMGFKESVLEIPAQSVSQSIIKGYDQTRNYPAINGTSKLGIHFRFGTISVRQKALKAISLNPTFLNELIWRDFYAMILYHFPHVEKNSFRPEYDKIEWRNNENEFTAWCEGKTGYPIVDAGMRELSQTGYMHNRVRMITASFLTKHLLIDWRWGEAWFAAKLLDFDLASNNGGWQWAAGCGTDAAPYFRIFSPEAQTAKFDKDWVYIKKWIPELNSEDYPAPMVDHAFARKRCLDVYKQALRKE